MVYGMKSQGVTIHELIEKCAFCRETIEDLTRALEPAKYITNPIMIHAFVYSFTIKTTLISKNMTSKI